MLRIIKRAAQSVGNINPGRGYLQRNGPVGSGGPNIHHCRLYMPYKCPSEGRRLFLWRATRESFNKCSSSRNFSVTSSNSNAATHHSQIASKRLFRNYCSSGDGAFPFSPTINRIARVVVSLALVRSYLLVPGIFAFTCGWIALSRSVLAFCMLTQGIFELASMMVHVQLVTLELLIVLMKVVLVYLVILLFLPLFL